MKRLLILIILAVVVTVAVKDEEVIQIPSTSIRMRVIAKSDDKKDQEDKVKVKSALESKLYDITKNSTSYADFDREVGSSKAEIDEYLNDFMKQNGIDTEFRSNYGFNYFPEKTFKGVTYKSGNYKSFVVTLGQGEGENWWCVLYPPLCLIDENKEEYEYHSLIKDAILKYN